MSERTPHRAVNRRQFRYDTDNEVMRVAPDGSATIADAAALAGILKAPLGAARHASRWTCGAHDA
jgi:hypothetical protein